MAEVIVSQVLSLINRQIHSHETMGTYLSKLEALLEIAMKSEGFLAAVPHDYHWVMSDIVGQAKKDNEGALDCLLQDSLRVYH